MLERLTVRLQQAEGSYRGELTTFLRRSFVIAASRGEKVQKDMHGRLYEDIDRTWASLNKINAGYMSFELIYNFMAARIVSYAPGLLSYMNAKVDLKGYVTGAELINSLIQQCSWFIHVMPAIANLRANARRVTEVANAIENVQHPPEYYRLTGLSEFGQSSQHAVFGLTLRNVELMHRGEAEPFLAISNLRFRRGEWTMIKGESGCGKTSLIKAINGLWPYGRGDIVFPEGVKTFYAAQEVKLPGLSLKQLVCLPDSESRHPDARAAAALHKAGLGSFIEFLGEEGCEGKPWDQVLSGGQKQKLVLARILLHRPGLLFLDEATGALDPEAKTAFHQAIKDNCPDVTVISVMHEMEPPRSEDGEGFYGSLVRIEDGVAIKTPMISRTPADLIAAAAQSIEVEARRPLLPMFTRAKSRQRELN
jgi:putative ATP-binding cassette transporter